MAKKKNVKIDEVVTENTMEETIVENVEETVAEEKTMTFGFVDFGKGIVSNCIKLNVRKKPTKDSDVVCVVSQNDELIINDYESDKWYKVTTKDGKKGFCMKEFVKFE